MASNSSWSRPGAPICLPNLSRCACHDTGLAIARRKQMPHVTVKLVRGKSEDQKTRLAEQITRDVVNILNYGVEAVSVAFEEVEPQAGQRKFISPRFRAMGTSLQEAGLQPV